MRRLIAALVMVLALLPSAPPTQAEDRELTSALAALSQPDRQFLSLDPRGDGRVVEVLGDLEGATHIAILVPGADTTLETFDARGAKPYASPGGGARSLRAEATSIDPQAELAVVAWLGYDAPRTLSLDAITDGRAIAGAAELRHQVTALHRVNHAEISLLCHSYGARVCAQTARGLPVTDLVAYGSPDLGVETVAELHTDARVWVGQGTADWVRYFPGPDPVAPRFGARVFAAGDAGHSDYLAPGTPSLRNLALIALGRPHEVRHG